VDEQEQRARELVQQVFAKESYSLTDADVAQWFRQCFQAVSLDVVIACAREGDRLAVEELRERARDMRHGRTIPTEMLEFVLDCYIDGLPRTRPGPRPYGKATRDVTIEVAVAIAVEIGACSERRACKLVTAEIPKRFNVGLHDVAKIWRNSAAKASLKARGAAATLSIIETKNFQSN
jgi:hypothetical protein